MMIKEDKTMSDEEKKAIETMSRKMKLHEEKPTSVFAWLTLEEHYVRILLNLVEKQNKIINEMANKLEEHIKFCEQEASGSLHNDICHISLKFNKSLLDIINGKENK